MAGQHAALLLLPLLWVLGLWTSGQILTVAKVQLIIVRTRELTARDLGWVWSIGYRDRDQTS